MLKRIFCYGCLILSLSAHSEPNTLNLVALSYSPDVSSVLLYQPLVEALAEPLPGYAIKLRVTDAENLYATMAQLQSDVIILDPAHYLAMRRLGYFDGALMTLSQRHGTQSTNLMGGVMFTRSDNRVVTLSNLSQHSVASTSPVFLENYMVHAYEMSVLGVDYPKADALVVFPEASQVVEAVLSRRQEVGFLRTGALERLVREGRFTLNDVKVLHPQTFADYPFVVSTRLYPEWVLVVGKHVSDHVTQQLKRSLLNRPLQEAQVAYGFGPPLDYSSVERVLVALSVDQNEEGIDWQGFFGGYVWYLLLVNIGAVALIGLSWYTCRKNKQLASLIKEEKRAQALLTQSKQQLDSLLSSSPTVIYSLDPEHHQLEYISSNCQHLYGKTADEVKGVRNGWQHAIFDDDLSKVLALFRQWRIEGCRGTLIFSYRLARENDWIWIENRLQALRNDKGDITLFVGAHSDASERHQNEEQLELWASVFANAREGIAITTPKGEILDVNSAFSRITGYSRTEIIGENPRILNSGRQSKEFYREMWRQIIKAGFWEGEIWNKRKNGSIYAQNLTVVAVKDTLDNVSHYISLFSDITRQKRNEEQLEHIAYFDALTGLPNRTNLTSSLGKKIGHSTAHGTQFSLAFLDLDGFKEVNDTFGHDTGDLLLVEVAKRMRKTLGADCIVARFGGDEFVLLIPMCHADEKVEPQLQRLLNALAQPFKVSTVTLHISASIGVTFYPQHRPVEADQLIRQADQAMYQAKISGRNRLKLFDLSLEDILVEQHRFYDELLDAFEKKQFCLYYQPKVNMRSHVVHGFEALIRWQHPTRGLLIPAAFLPALTNQPLELDLGQWVIKTALAQLSDWYEMGYQHMISVNLAGYQLQQEGFVSELAELLKEYPRAIAELLELEILETSAIEDLATVSGVIEACKALGLKMSLDDFGTGYSTLSHLKELSVDMLKIDRGFVRDMLEDKNDLAIIKGVIGFAEAFSLDVIAEGVETEQHAARLLELGCELGQGYFISPPLPASKVIQWYDDWLVSAGDIE